MKKVIAMMLCLMLTLSCAAGLAEAAEKNNLSTVTVNGAFEIRCALPEGYTTDTEQLENGGMLSVIKHEDPQKPWMVMSIMFNDLYADVKKLNDLDEEALALIESTFTEEFEAEISYAEPAHGTKLMVMKEANGELADVYTIYQGYEIEFVLVPAESGPEALTDEQIQLIVDFLSDLDFEPVE